MKAGAALITLMKWITRAFSAAGSALVMVIMVAILADILGRFFFNRPLPGTAEVVVMSITAIVFLQMAGALESRKIIMSDGFVEYLGKRSVRAQQWLLALQHATGALMFTLIAWYVWPLLTTVYASQDYFGEVALMTFPKWPIYTVILTGSILMALQYLVQTIEHLQAGIQRRALPATHADKAESGEIG